ncbi:T9SS-dependent choice-of-anchor J family protein [Flavobacterium selenitireducens]|uniref:T9SS-dependent choice-of-anchor J family protein n=1 Tax=Flavobacterium selenitireducens TaxID=2722704 RepID=UPI00168A7498|nr:choice-of-anchor J domain-containing protein [Flavobacterium selenitireducens]MBD3582498.1 T9SS type A sorting domain-containing protein [Flavobacterium selenitireducens]
MKKFTLALLAFCCGLVGRAQFTQDFEAGMSGWLTLNSGDESTWTILDLSATGFLAVSGSNVVTLDATVSAQDDYLISPAITVTAGVNDYISFWARNRGLDLTADIDVLVSTTGTDLVDFDTTLEAEVNPPIGLDFFRYGIDLSAYVGQTIHLAFHASADASVAVDLDDIVNTALPDCEAPSGFIATDITADSAILSWLSAGLGNNVQIEYGPSGFALGTGTVVNLSNTLLLPLTNLTLNGDLDVYIRTDCGDGNFSDWIQLDLSLTADTDNDDCAGAINLAVGTDFASGAVLSTSIGATMSNEDTPSCGIGVSGDVWFTAVVPTNGSLTVQTALALGSLNLDTVVAVYTGTCGDLTQVACNDNTGLLNLFSSVTVDGLDPGSTVYIAVYQNGLLGVIDGSFLVSAFSESLANSGFERDGLRFYPNPVTSTLNLTHDQTIIRSVRVYNELGQTVIRRDAESGLTQIDMSDLSNGLYFVDVEFGEGSRRLKIMKQ